LLFPYQMKPVDRYTAFYGEEPVTYLSYRDSSFFAQALAKTIL